MKLNFAKLRVGYSDELLQQVRTVLADIPLSDIQHALALSTNDLTDIKINSVRLLYYYQCVSRRRKRPIFFFLGSAVTKPLKALIVRKAELQDKAIKSVLHKTALEIIEEFIVCLDYRDQLRKRNLQQRRILANNYAKFSQALVLRDGKQCLDCKSKRKRLFIDHKRPIAKGGLSELINLQLLCFGCNSKKSDTFEEE